MRHVDVAKLRELFDYYPWNGWLVHKVNRGRARKGARVGCVMQPSGYRVVRIGSTVHYEHRLIWALVTGEQPPERIDHRDRDKANNIFSNFRAATGSQNNANGAAQKHGKLKVLGVRVVDGSYQARVTWHGVEYTAPRRKTIGEAILDRMKLEAEHHGEFAAHVRGG